MLLEDDSACEEGGVEQDCGKQIVEVEPEGDGEAAELEAGAWH